MYVRRRDLHAIGHAVIGVMLAFASIVSALAQDEEHIFEPGTKHVCVPAANGEGWDCGDVQQPPTKTASTRDGPVLRSAHAGDPPDPTDPGTTTTSSQPSEAEMAALRDERPQSRSLPSYLLAPPGNAGYSSSTEPEPARAEPASAAPAEPARTERAVPSAQATVVESSPTPPAPTIAAPEPVPQVSTATTPSSLPAEPQAAAPEATTNTSEPIAAPPVAAPLAPSAPEPVAAEPPAPAPVSRVALPDDAVQRAAFAALPSSGYVLELAHGNDANSVAAEASIALPVGRVWVLRMRRDGSDWFVALWGDFSSVDAARQARDVAAAHGVAAVGWPRKIGPLQQELLLQRR